MFFSQTALSLVDTNFFINTFLTNSFVFVVSSDKSGSVRIWNLHASRAESRVSVFLFQMEICFGGVFLEHPVTVGL